jgi:Dolichyl-phosphate-mannose-protein mannosyltransferase
VTFSVLATKLSRLAFGIACAAGLAGAWIGLTHNSFWFDELSGAATIGDATNLRAMLLRVATDITPPVYYVALFYFAKIFGTGDAALRAFSAFFGCLSIAVFFLGTRRSFSLSGRLFAGALATGSAFWFFQSQNARFYTLCLALSAIILVLALSILRQPQRSPKRGLLAALAAVILLGAFVHYYFTIEGLAVLLILFLYRPGERLQLCVIAGLLVASTLLYLKVVVGPYVQIDPNNFYIPRSFAWYPYMLRTAFHLAFGRLGALALGLCLLAIVVGYFLARKHAAPVQTIVANLRTAIARDGTEILIVGVPVLTLVGGIVSSLLLSPNFTDRNLLICSPFIWALSARLYDGAQQSIGTTGRAALDLALALIALSMASVVLQRTGPKSSPYLWSEPFRQSAEWIRNVPACRGAIIPVVDIDRKAWYRGDYADRLYGDIYGRYLAGYARPKIVFLEDIEAHRIDAGMAAEMRDRLDGKGCPVIGWSAHGVYEEAVPGMRSALLAALDRQAAPADLVATHIFNDGGRGFILEVRQSAR